MPAQTIETPVMTEAQHKASFFRQSGWMMIAVVGSGVLMSLVHVFSKVIPESEYAVLGTLIASLNWITIPAIGLQTTFAQQASGVVTEDQRRALVGTTWAVFRGIFYVWMVMAVGVLIWHAQLIAVLKINNPACLWVTLAVGLVMLWRPIFQGLLQGRQNFLWLGWAFVFDGVGRLFIAGLIVFCLHGWTAGIMTGALIGMVAALGVGMWQNRDFFGAPSVPFESGPWLRRIIPLSIGCGASQFLFSADAILVQSSNLPGAASYLFAGTLARAIVLFTAPLVAVMFPKLVHSAVRNQKSDLMLLTLFGTAVLSGVAAVGLTIVAPFLIKYGSNPGFITIQPLIWLFAWSFVPLGVGNVLLNNLMAHSRFKCVPYLAAVAIGYWIALQHFHDSFKMVIQVLGIFNTIFLIVCTFFTWGVDRKRPVEMPV